MHANHSGAGRMNDERKDIKDIVERLRGHTWADADHELYREAANEIERLRFELEWIDSPLNRDE